ncbi:MAG TPA: hypothetical protein VFF30_02480 [Nitrososphaerales archaeon]|nr:hypothetical protein [Nitrososphaerales archaeon]
MSNLSEETRPKGPATVTVTFKLKYLWLVVGIIMLLLAVSPIVYLYTAPSAQSTPTPSGGGGGSTAAVNCPNPCTITIKNSVFGTGQTVVISKGTTVVWKNADDTTHTSTSTSGIWDTGILSPGQSSKPVTFSSDGNFPYICQVHPMQGLIQVVG